MNNFAEIANPIGNIIEPRCVAVIGASEDISKYGGRVMNHLVSHRFSGRIVPINTSRSTIFGIPAKSSVLEAGCAIDVALLAVPEHALEATIADCIKAKVGCGVIIASGLGERDEAGKKRQEELVRVARLGGMRILGPNCLGFVSPDCNLALTPSFILSNMRLAKGGVALLSQSGALMATMLGRGIENGVGFRVCVSFGNQADLTIEEFLEYLVSDAKTTAIVIYVEEVRDASRFFDACEAARANGKHVVVCKAGSSAAGRGTTLSHTASLAGDYSAFQAVCSRHQVLITDDPDSASLCAAVLARWNRGHGKRIAVISGSGGGVAVTSDYLTRCGFVVPRLEESTTARLRRFYETFSGFGAFDYGALPSTMKGREAWVLALKEIMTILAEDSNIDAIAYVMTAQPQMIQVAQLVSDFATESKKPVLLALTAGSAGNKVRDILMEANKLFFDNVHELAAALNMLSQPRVEEDDYLPRPRHVPINLSRPHFAALNAASTDGDARAMLRAAGIDLPIELLVDSLDDALNACEKLGYPVVLKAMCSGLVHKSDAGLVKLGITDAMSLKKSWLEIKDALRDPGVSAQVSGLIVQQQLHGGIEIFVGTRWAPEMGAIVVVGFGGTLVELVKDVAILSAPISAAGAEKQLRKLKLWPLLSGFRGGVPMDVNSVAKAISRISILAATAGSSLVELDVNPLMVFKDGVVAVDCRATMRDENGETVHDQLHS